jgi:serine/threonine protein kinase/Tol biopolymer transport system component
MSNDVRDQLQKTLGEAITIDRELGGGGMSRVFVATDATLGRQIVVKMLPSDAVPTASLERFHREIRTAAKLQHPHIVPVLSAGESGGLPFYTMPFVPGESLRHRLAKGGELSVNETVHVLRDIAAALAYAHGEGVVHRDIKPENVMLSGGVAVVTDFGVAKAVDMAATDSGHKQRDLTSLGVALGTPAYMSPEQATADPHVDHRSDIYSFGCVAYEMLAGVGPFAGRTPQQMLAAHVQEVPESLLKRRPSVPPALAALVMRCLEKRSGDRPQSAEELIVALDAIATPSGGTPPTAARLAAARPAKRRLFMYAGAKVLVLVAIVTYLVTRTPAVVQLSQQTPVANSSEIEIDPAISPDGKFVAYSAGAPGQFRIYVKQIAGGRASLLTGDLDGNHAHPVWSPDGSQIAFEAGGAAYSVPAFGGVPRRLFGGSSEAVNSLAWSADGKRIAYVGNDGLWVRDVGNGTATRLVTGGLFHSLVWSRDGRLLAFIEGIRSHLFNVSVGSVWLVQVNTGERRQVASSSYVNMTPAFLPDGTLLYVSNRDGALDVYQQALHADGRTIGEPVRLTTGLFARTISISADGTRMAYDVVRNRSRIWMAALPRDGAVSFAGARQITNENEHIEGLGLSHDGAWLAYDSDRSGSSHLYKLRLPDGSPIQLTTKPGNDFKPTWSHDDKELVFHSARNGDRDIYVISADGSAEQHVTHGPRQDFSPDWSPNDRQLVFAGGEQGKPGGLYATERSANGIWNDARPIAVGKVFFGLGWSTSARWSPDGTRIAAVIDVERRTLGTGSPDSGVFTPVWTSGTSRHTISFFRWKNDGNIYLSTASPDSGYMIWSLPDKGGKPRLLLHNDATHRLGHWEFETDGKRILFTLAANESDVWVVELKR